MALNVDWGNTPVYKEFLATTPDGDFTDSNGYPRFPIGDLMFSMMIVQQGRISEKNAHKVFARLSLYLEAMVGGSFSRVWDGEKVIEERLSPEHIKSAMGLRVNVSDESDTSWVQYFLRLVKRENAEPVAGMTEWSTATIKRHLAKYEVDYLAS
jgi:hypothetical protein